MKTLKIRMNVIANLFNDGKIDENTAMALVYVEIDKYIHDLPTEYALAFRAPLINNQSFLGYILECYDFLDAVYYHVNKDRVNECIKAVNEYNEYIDELIEKEVIDA